MPTDITKTIAQTNTPVAPDYTLLTTWWSDCPVDLTVSDNRYVGNVLDQGELTAGVTMSGVTSDATRYPILQTASGASFRDKAGVRTTALTYNAANGAAVKVTTAYSNTILVSVPYTQIRNLQLWGTGASTNCITSVSGWDNGLCENCIVIGSVRSSGVSTFVNCLIEGVCGPANSLRFHYCTLVGGGSTNIANGVYGSSVCVNTALFDNGGTAFSGASFSGSNNATDAASAPGTSNQTGLNYASQFVNSASDWRAVDTGSLKNGTPDATFATTDITGATRDVTTPYIGCWEVVAVIPSGTARSLFRPANLTLGSGGPFFSNPLT